MKHSRISKIKGTKKNRRVSFGLYGFTVGEEKLLITTLESYIDSIIQIFRYSYTIMFFGINLASIIYKQNKYIIYFT